MHEKKLKTYGVKGQHSQKTMIYRISFTAQTLCIYLLKYFTREDLNGKSCYFTNIEFETSRPPGTLTVLGS